LHDRLVQLGSFQAEVDSLEWTKDVFGELKGLSKHKASKHLLTKQILGQKEYQTVVTAFNASPLALKASKPSKEENRKNPGTLATWTELNLEAKLQYISKKPFPSQNKGMFPDPTAEVKRLKTFLYYHLMQQIKRDMVTEEDDDA